ncbi:MAG: PQQ-binding-like beta-propeller repeat protein [Verrucomicrobiales bacterium]
MEDGGAGAGVGDAGGGGRPGVDDQCDRGRERKFAVCLDLKTGVVLVNRKLWDNPDPEPLGNKVNSYGSPSAAADAERVYLSFGSYGTVCLDAQSGDEIWRRRDLPCSHLRGPGSSPVLWGDFLILTMDGADVQYLVALDKKTGKTIWRQDRSTEWGDIEPDGSIKADGDLRKAYSTPVFTEVGGKEIMISIGARATWAYDPATGKELWQVPYAGFSNASRAVVGDGAVFLNTGYGKAQLWRVRLDPAAAGDISGSHVEWKLIKNVPQRSTPVYLDGHLYMVDDGGIASCVDAKTGEQVWSERVRGNFSASALCSAEKRVYFFDERGKSYVVAA